MTETPGPRRTSGPMDLLGERRYYARVDMAGMP